MRGNNTFIFIVVGIVVLHFLIGIGWLAYKIMRGDSKKENKKNESSTDSSKMN